MYNNRDKFKERVVMASGIYAEIKKRILDAEYGAVFVTSDFTDISFMSESTTLVVEAIKTLGKERIDEGVINNLKNRVPEDKRKQLLEEATGVSEWIYEVIRKVCLE